ncbi:unnamed protein product [Pedinophyceae sp. YPF-701]|nr:unnamed protein product [Pedinophyceae sp. YPF-701]
MAAAATKSAPAKGKASGDTYRENSRSKDVRISNIEAAKAVADAVRTSLGPRGMDKMVAQADGEVIITNDGATILDKISVMQPAAKMLVDLAKSQDIVAGDGTTTVTVLCGALLKKCMDLLGKGIHPTAISDSFYLASKRAAEILDGMAKPIDLTDRDSFLKSASTSLNSKVVSQFSPILSPMAVDAVYAVLDKARPASVDLKDIRIVKRLGGTVEDSEMVDGLVFSQKAAKGAGAPSRLENAKVCLAQFHVSPPKSDMDMNVVVQDYTQMDRILREERNYILKLVKQIKASGCNVLLIQKSILRDAVSDLAGHYLAKAKIMVVRDIEREDIEFISKTLGVAPVAHIDSLRPERLADVGLVEEVGMSGGKVVKLTGIKNRGKTATVLLRGSNKLMLDEAERSLHDALCVVRSLCQKQAIIPGGAAPEVELTLRLSEWARTLVGMESYCVRGFAEALEVIPYTLAENAGLDPIQMVTELRKHHAEGRRYDGINVRKGCITDMMEEAVVQPLLVTSSAIGLASECVRMILKIDDIVPVR